MLAVTVAEFFFLVVPSTVLMIVSLCGGRMDEATLEDIHRGSLHFGPPELRSIVVPLLPRARKIFTLKRKVVDLLALGGVCTRIHNGMVTPSPFHYLIWRPSPVPPPPSLSPSPPQNLVRIAELGSDSGA